MATATKIETTTGEKVELIETNFNCVYDMSDEDIYAENNRRDKLRKSHVLEYGNARLSEFARAEFDPAIFTSFGNFARTNSRDLSTLIKENYQKVFHDLKGVYVSYVPGSPQPFVVSFFFSKNREACPSGKIVNLKDLTVITSGGQNNLFDKMQALQHKARKEQFTINDETKVILSDIMFGGRDANKPSFTKKWNAYISQIYQPSNNPVYYNNSGELVVVVSGCFDIHSILRKIMPPTMTTSTFGQQDPVTGKVTCKNVVANAGYDLRFIKYDQRDPNLFYMNIEQYDRDGVEKIYREENPIRPVQSGVLFYY